MKANNLFLLHTLLLSSMESIVRGDKSDMVAQEIASLQSWLDNQVNTKNQIVGVSAFVVAGDGPIETVASGKAVLAQAWDVTTRSGVSATPKDVTADSTCMMASVSKIFTWTALTMLLDAGKFELDDDIDDILSFRIRNPDFPNMGVSYRQLYAHTSGIKDKYNGYRYGKQCPSHELFPYSTTESLEASIRKITDVSSGWAWKRPGSTYLYSNYGTAVAAMLVEKHSGMTFPEFMKKYIFEPLQMTSTQYSRPTDGSAAELYTLYNKNGYKYKTNSGGYCFPDYPSGQLWSTTGDLGKFATAMLKRGNLGYTTSDGANCLYSEVSGALAFQKISPSTGDGDSALGWFVGSPYYTGGAGHDGSETGTSSDFFVHLDNNIAIGYWANGELTNNQYKLLYDRLLQTANAIGGINNSYNSNKPQQCTTVLSVSSPTAPTPSVPTPTPPTSTDCDDTPLRFQVRLSNGRLRFKRCIWARKNKNRCNLTGVSENCPSYCGTCSICANAPLKIKVRKNGMLMKKDCSWATSWHCNNLDGIAESCRSTCEVC